MIGWPVVSAPVARADKATASRHARASLRAAGHAQRLVDLLGDGRSGLVAPLLMAGGGRIPRAYALARLLEHGRMSREDLLSCTRWPVADLNEHLGELCRARMVRRVRNGCAGRDVFELVADGLRHAAGPL